MNPSDDYQVVVSHPGKKHWRWEVLRNYREQVATSDVCSLKEAWAGAQQVVDGMPYRGG